MRERMITQRMWVLTLAVSSLLVGSCAGSEAPQNDQPRKEERPPAPAPGPQKPSGERQSQKLSLQSEDRPQEKDFANQMSLPLAEATEPNGRFVFEFTAPHDGSLVLDAVKNFRYSGIDCTLEEGRSFVFDLTWSVVQADGRLQKVVGYSPFINLYPFRAGENYRLVYEIENMSRVFADCQSVEIRFAIQEYKER